MSDVIPEITVSNQRRGGFKPGQSGNPMGRPKKTAANIGLKSLSATEKLLSKNAKGVAETVVRLAKEGDMGAARLVLDRVSPPRKGRLTTFPMAPIKTQADVADALQGLLEATAAGFLTPTESTELAAVVEKLGNALESSELESRILKLEALAERGR
jgi:hypothetical protein